MSHASVPESRIISTEGPVQMTNNLTTRGWCVWTNRSFLLVIKQGAMKEGGTRISKTTESAETTELCTPPMARRFFRRQGAGLPSPGECFRGSGSFSPSGLFTVDDSQTRDLPSCRRSFTPRMWTGGWTQRVQGATKVLASRVIEGQQNRWQRKLSARVCKPSNR